MYPQLLIMRFPHFRWLSVFTCLLLGGTAFARPQGDRKSPSDHTNIRATHEDAAANCLIVTVGVPRGTKRVTLQSLDGANGWVTRAVAHADGLGGQVTFRAPRGMKRKQLRVIGDASDPLPVTASNGQTSFAVTSTVQPSSPAVGRSTNDIVPTAGGILSVASSQSGTDTTPRTVTESDIWKISGNTLYFFNQLRGLQIIDITNPDAPVRGGTLSLPAVGEEMYVLDDSHVVLLARKGTRWDLSEAILVTITNGLPAITARLDVNGFISTSRLVGTALYVASDGYTNSAWGTILSSFDFSNLAAPAARNSLFIGGWGNAVTATDRFFFIATSSNWNQSDVAVVDISDAGGTMAAKGTIHAAGHVADKFKMGLNGDVFTIVSQIWSWTNGINTNISKLETFSLADPNAPAKLGELGIGQGEQLYATRLEGNRAYVVTAQQIDPLWIIDLADPANPKVAGQVEVPGFSTFIQPLGDQLVTIGIVNHQVSVSLFDVKDPAAPALLSRVAAGGSYSWSEAVWNEKAFTVLPDAGLILVPVSGWDSNSGYASQVQIIDLGGSSLAARGVINQDFQPRRATAFGSRILSISSHELMTVNATDRDHPAVTSDVALAWSVDRVFVRGDYLIEVENGGSWQGGSPTLRIASLTDADQVQSEVDLDGAPVCGTEVRDGKLYVAQAESGFNYLPLVTTDGGGTGATDGKSPLTVSIYDLSKLPELPLLGKTETRIDPLGWSPTLTALWPKPGVLVWASAGRSYGPIFWGRPIAVDAVPVALAGGVLNATGVASSSATTVGGGTLTLNGAQNNYGGVTTVNGGTLTLVGGQDYTGGALVKLGNGNLNLTGSLNLSSNPGLNLSGSFSGGTVILTGSLNLITTGTGMNTLHPPARRTATTTVSSGTLTVNGAGSLRIASPWWYGGGSQGRLIAFDLTDASAPAFLSEKKYATDAWSVGAAFAADGAIYASHAGMLNYGNSGDGDWAWIKTGGVQAIYRGWAQGWFLDVIDFSDPAAPVLRAPASIPTTLIGIANATAQSATLFTLGWHAVADTSGQSLDASAYDGVVVTLLDTVALSGWSNPAAVDGVQIFVGKSDNDAGGIDTWTLSGDGKLALLGTVALDSVPWNLNIVGGVLAAQVSGKVVLFDKSDAAALKQIGASDPNSSFFGMNLGGADGDVTRGLWVPLGEYGVQAIGVK